jgi:hypothetical protein
MTRFPKDRPTCTASVITVVLLALASSATVPAALADYGPVCIQTAGVGRLNVSVDLGAPLGSTKTVCI